MIRFHPDVGFSVFFFHFASAGKVKYATEIDETVAMLELLDATWLMVVIPLMPLVIFPEFPKMLSLHDRHRSTCIYWVITNKVNDLVEKLTQSIGINPICDKKKEKNMFIQINPESWCRKKHKIKYFMFQSSGLLNSLIQRLASSHLVSPGDVSICSGRKWYVCHFLVLSPLPSSFIVNDETVYILYILLHDWHLSSQNWLSDGETFSYSPIVSHPLLPCTCQDYLLIDIRKRQYSFWSTFRWNESNSSSSLLII